eukprot:Phypoly_transcript_00811.p1 GENE.Phypoly_transcript_00811~~Phypoly_transcript_00811.p1  ORF type:complete len:1025 (+),score=144.56 Phypoly_transcript_00811:182-3256(+)
MPTIKLGLIGDEPGASSFLSAFLNSHIGSAAEISVCKSIVVDGETQKLEISSCQWQAGALLEIKNPTIKYSDGFMFICRPSGNAMKLRTIRKTIYSVLKVRGKIPMVIVSNELSSDASLSFDENLVYLQTLFASLRCPILRTTSTKNDRMLGIMFTEITKLIMKYDYSQDPKGSNMIDYESTIIRETDIHDNFFGASPIPIPQEQVVPQWGADHQSARSLIFGSSTSPSPSPSSPSPSALHLPVGSPPISSRLPSPRLSIPTYASSPNLPATTNLHFVAPTTLHHSPAIMFPKFNPSLGNSVGSNMSTSPNLSVHVGSPSLSPSPSTSLNVPVTSNLGTSPTHFRSESRGVSRLPESQGSASLSPGPGLGPSPSASLNVPVTSNLGTSPTHFRSDSRGVSRLADPQSYDSPSSSSRHSLSRAIPRLAEPHGSESPHLTLRSVETHAEVRRAESRSEPVAARTVTPTKAIEALEVLKTEGLSDRKSYDSTLHIQEALEPKADSVEKQTLEKPERSNLSDSTALRNLETRTHDSPSLDFKLTDKKAGDESGSPWDDSFNPLKTSQKIRKESDSGKRTLRPRKFPPISPPHTPPHSPTALDQPLTEDVFEDIVPPEVKLQRAHLQQQIIARKAYLDKEAELEEVTCKIVVIGAPKSGKTGFIENIAQTGSSYAIHRDGSEEGVSVNFDRHLQKNWKCFIIEPARERKVAFQLSMTNADAYVIVYNICSRQSFELLPTFFQEIIEAKGDLKGPIMLIGTKLDDANNREVSREEGQKTAQSHGSSIIFHEISSKTHQNVHTCFPSLLNSFLLRKFKPLSPKGSLPTIFGKTGSVNKALLSPTTSPPNPFGPSSPLTESSELKPPTTETSSTATRSMTDGKSSGKMLSNLCQSMREPNSGLKRKKKQFFSGADAIEWITQKTQASHQDADIWCQKLMASGYIRPIVMIDSSDASVSIDGTRSKFLGGDELYIFESNDLWMHPRRYQHFAKFEYMEHALSELKGDSNQKTTKNKKKTKRKIKIGQLPKLPN